MKYKLIVADFDDTIMNEDFVISDTLSDTVKRYEAAGGKFRIATGRMTTSILRFARQLNLTGEVLSFQGAVVSDIATGETIQKFSIPSSHAEVIAREIEKKGVYFHTYEEDSLVCEKQTMFSKIYQRLSDCDCIELGYPVSEYIRNSGLSPVKFIIMDAAENVAAHIDYFSKRFSDDLLVNTSKEWIVEMISNKVSKGKAVEWLAKRLGVSREETITIGDSLNDATMLEWAGLSFCVDNGSAAGKAAAKAVCPACDDKGVEWVIRKYGLGEEI